VEKTPEVVPDLTIVGKSITKAEPAIEKPASVVVVSNKKRDVKA